MSVVPEGLWEAESAHVGEVRLANPLLTVNSTQEATLDGTTELGLLQAGTEYPCVVETDELHWHCTGTVTVVNPGGRQEKIQVQSHGPIEVRPIEPAA